MKENSNIINTKNNEKKDDLYFFKSKTMYNLSNEEDKKIKILRLEKNKSNMKHIKKNISLDIQKNDNNTIRKYLNLEHNTINNNNIHMTKNINANIHKTERNINKTLGGKIMSEFDNIIYSKKTNSNKKEYDKTKIEYNNNKINIKNLGTNINNIFQFKLPLSKRINLYSGLENDFYKKGKIISFMNKVNKKSKNYFENKENNINTILNFQRLEQTKRFNFMKDKNRQGLSLGNVNKTPIIKIKSSYSSLE